MTPEETVECWKCGHHVHPITIHRNRGLTVIRCPVCLAPDQIPRR